MADLIEIGVEVRTGSIKSANRELDSLGNTLKSAERSASAFVEAFERQERQVSRAAQSNRSFSNTAQTMYREILKVDQATKSASASASVFSANLDKQAASAARVAAEEERLRRKYVEGYAAMDLYSKELNQLAVARKANIISAQQQIQLTDRLNKQMASGTGVFSGYGTAQQAATKSSNSMGVVTQQAGYQVGDFLVQVQGGTNVMVAFGQQATQLVGVLPLIADRLGMTTKAAIGLSAALGIGIPLVTAIGAFLLRARESANKAAEGVDTLADSIESLDKSLRDYLQTKKASQLGITVEELLGTQNIAGAEAELDSAREALERLITSASVTPTGMFAGVAIVDFIKQKLATDEVTAAVLRLAQAEETLGLLRQKQGEERFSNYAEERVVLQEQLAMAQEISRFGEDSAQVAKLELEQRIAAYDRNIDQLVESNQLNIIHARTLKTINAEIARTEAGYVSVEEKIQRISREIEAATQFKLSTVFETASRAIDGMNSRLGVTLSQLGGIMSSINSVLIDTVSVQAESEALAAGKSATEAANAARIAREITTLTGTGNAEDLTLAQAAAITALTEALGRNGVASDKLKAQQDALRDAAKGSKKSLEDLKKEIDKLNETAAAGLTPFDKYNTALKNLDVLRAAGLSNAAYSMEIERLNEELAKSLPMVNDVADAFGDFLARGLTDFKSFANSIFKSFQNMLAQMITTAARNRILISMGATGSMAGPASAASNLAQGAGMLGSVGTFASSIGTGLGVVGNGFMAGGLSGAATATAGAVSGGIGMGGAAGFGTALGAAIPVIGAVALVFGALRKTTKELDSGLNVTVKNMDALVTSFKTVETSRFFGLSKKTSTSTGGVSSGVSDPIVAAVQQIQQSVLTAAEAFGFGADAFDNFSYEFKLSLKGLSEEQQMQKINEELTKMGDSFASLTGHFSSMNELLEAAEQRYQIENRMLEALGNSSELLSRNRERELAATHALNRGLLQATFNLEDAQAAVDNAFTGLRAAIDKVVTELQAKLSVANEAVNRSRSIFNQLESALSGRSLTSGIGQTFARREGALGFLKGGDFSDEKKLDEALRVVSEPTEDLFGSFVDYAREFARTSRTLEDAKNVAETQLTADEKQVMLLEQQIASAEAQYQIQVDQYNALLGIDTSVQSVGEAIATLKGAIEALAKAQEAAKAAAASAGAIGGGASGGGSVKEVFGTGEKYKDFDLAKIRGSSDLLKAAQLAGVGTSGKTGAQIQQAISNATGLAVNMDNATRGQQFARGGMFNGGMRLVGEEGPELEVTGPSRIYSKQQTKDLLRGGDSNEGEGLRAEVSEMRQELRQLLIANNKYTKRSYDIYNKWDIDGLPAERT
jgi:tetratricopeptide (TPR) repeat protein